MKKYLFCIAIISVMFGCSQEQKQMEVSTSKMELNRELSDSTAEVKIVKTADMRFRVKDVQQTKENLSSILKSQGGTVAEFSIQSSIQGNQKVKYSTDSLREITSYRTEGYFVAKIPSEKLDDFTNTIAKMAVFVDQQAMKMDDQSMNYLANRLKAQNRIDVLKSINKTAKRKNTNIETSLYLKDDYVDRKIENLEIDDRVKFSTITLNFYQDNTVKVLTVANDHIADYRPAFFQRLGLNIISGWIIFKEIILFLANLWVLIAFGLIAFFCVRYYTRKGKVVLNG